MAILLKNLDKSTMELIYDYQTRFRLEKGRHVSLEQTVARLLKDAYLSGKLCGCSAATSAPTGSNSTETRENAKD